MLLLLILLCIIDKNLETKWIVLVISQTKAIIHEQESIGPPAIAVEKLVAFLVAWGELGAHGEVDPAVILDALPPRVVFCFVKSNKFV